MSLWLFHIWLASGDFMIGRGRGDDWVMGAIKIQRYGA